MDWALVLRGKGCTSQQERREEAFGKTIDIETNAS